MFCFYCQRYFSLSHSKKEAKPLCSFAPGTLGCWMESRCCQRTALFLFFGLGLEVYTYCGDYAPSPRMEKTGEGFRECLMRGRNRTGYRQAILEMSMRKWVWVVSKEGTTSPIWVHCLRTLGRKDSRSHGLRNWDDRDPCSSLSLCTTSFRDQITWAGQWAYQWVPQVQWFISIFWTTEDITTPILCISWKWK